MSTVDANKSSWLKDIGIFVVVHVSLDFHKVSNPPKSYATPELRAWSTLAKCGNTKPPLLMPLEAIQSLKD